MGMCDVENVCVLAVEVAPESAAIEKTKPAEEAAAPAAPAAKAHAGLCHSHIPNRLPALTRPSALPISRVPIFPQTCPLHFRKRAIYSCRFDQQH